MVKVNEPETGVKKNTEKREQDMRVEIGGAMGRRPTPPPPLIPGPLTL